MIKLVNYKTYPQRGKDWCLNKPKRNYKHNNDSRRKMKILTNKQTTKQTNKQNHPSKKKENETNNAEKNNPYRYWTPNSFLVCLIHLKRLFLR